MTVTEQARHRLHTHLEEIMGEEHAAAIMEWLPDGPLASKADIDQLRSHMDLRFDYLKKLMDVRWEHTATKEDLAGVRIEIAGVRSEMHEGFTKQTWRLVTALIAINSLFFTAIEVL